MKLSGKKIYPHIHLGREKEYFLKKNDLMREKEV